MFTRDQGACSNQGQVSACDLGQRSACGWGQGSGLTETGDGLSGTTRHPCQAPCLCGCQWSVS